jgi:penicillin amidase
MQMDQVSAAARNVARSLGQLETSDPELQEVIEHLRAWDGDLAPGSPEAAVYEVFMQRLAKKLLESQLGELAIRYSGKGPTPVLMELSLFGERSREWLQKVLADPDSPWYGDGNGQLWQAAVLDALRETVAGLKEACGPEIKDWSWGQLHRLTFGHTLGSQKPLDKVFNRGPYPIGGDFDTVWAAGASYTEVGDQPVIGPPFRFIADLSDWNKTLWILAPGQSGHPGSAHYADNIRSWLQGEYYPLPFDRVAVLAAAKAKFVLEPNGG